MNLKDLNRLPTPADIDVRVGNTYVRNGKPYAQLLFYKDARADRNLLDEVVGPENWQCEFRTDGGTGTTWCGVGIRCLDKTEEYYEWVWKWDCGDGKANDPKGIASDAFKRAASAWGCFRQLYDFPRVYVELNEYEAKIINEGDRGKERVHVYASFRPGEWLWDWTNDLTFFRGVDTRGRTRFELGSIDKSREPEALQKAEPPITAAQRELLEKLLRSSHIQPTAREFINDALNKGTTTKHAANIIDRLLAHIADNKDAEKEADEK